MKTYRQSIHEALLLIAAATILGFAYTFVTKQGFFSEKKPAPSMAAANLEMISLKKAKELYGSQGVLFVDARHDFEYKMGHIHGAINIALREIDTHRIQLESIPKEKMLIVYCDGVECNSSIELALKLMDWKFTNVKVFFGGWQEWKTNNLPIDY
ncbi:MAG: rhodanese-like domain-containing protein [Bacteroidota bacterium]